MLILDFRTGKMTKLAFDFGYVTSAAIPGALLGLGGAGLGSLIDMLAGTKRRWTTILGLTGLAGGAGVGGLLRYLDKRSNTPTAQAIRFLDEASKPASEELVQQMLDAWPGKIAYYRDNINTQPPVWLLRDLIWPVYKESGVWLDKPRIIKFQLARYFVSQLKDGAKEKERAIDLAMDIAVRWRLLSLYQEQIPENLRSTVETHFRNYVNETIKQFDSKQPDWGVPRSHLTQLTDLLLQTNQEELKELAMRLASPYIVQAQKT